jgi:magnesium transporter
MANDVLNMTIKDQKTMFKNLDSAVVADFLPYVDASKRAMLFMRFSMKQHVSILNEMPSDDALDLVRLLPESYALKLIDQTEDKETFKIILGFEEDEIGAYITSDYIALYGDMTAKEATKKVVSEAPDVEVLSELLVIDLEEHLVGVISLKHLLKLEASKEIKEMIEPITFIEAKAKISEAISLMEASKQNMLPVVDQGILLGMITLDDALDLYEESSLEDLKKFNAIPDMHFNQISKDALSRLPWLVILLLFFIPIMLLTSSFEIIIGQFIILMLFQPLILGSSGNVATQALAIILQLLAKKESKISKIIFKELIASVLIAFNLGLIAFALTYFYGYVLQMDYPLLFAFVIGITLIFTLILSPMISMIITLSLNALKFDPAIASGPLITTIIDVTALLIYFSTATWLLGGLM